jgi:DNA-binding MarR family transcriptional regulator
MDRVEGKPPADLTHQVLLALRRIIRATDLHSRWLLQHFGLTAPQLVVLQHIARNGATSSSALAREASLSLPTLTGIVARLEARGLVQRTRNESDRRQLLVSLTESGAKLLEEAPPPLQETFTRQFATLRDWEQTLIVSILQRLVAMMEAETLEASAILATGTLDQTPSTVTVAENVESAAQVYIEGSCSKGEEAAR